ncbi:endonuclease MutS2 [Clostridia bacterium]|nr:endonuclease MutS2 [Clostridia bacterium]
MIGKDARTLELDKILEKLWRLCNNALSQELVEELEPIRDLDILKERYRENKEAVDILRLGYPVPVLRFHDIREHLKRTQSGGVLDVIELSDIKDFLLLNEEVLAAKNVYSEYECLDEWVSHLQSFLSLKDRLVQTVDNDGRILDKASKKLHALRRSQITIAARIKSRMEDLVHSDSGKKLLQDQLVTIRNNRYVVPLKAEHRGKIPGIIHDQSATGSTLYLEPNFAVELNNELKQNELDEQEEIRRILREMSREIADSAKILASNIRIIGELDFIFARARLSKEMDATSPRLNQTGFVHLKQARHPLIQGHVVPNDIMLTEESRCVVITGPNTGGKTIVLKTLGLLILMAEMGLDLPCDTDSDVALFDYIYADIGDEQSIEQSLSTYSSHMTNIIRIINQVTEQSLVLLDELGAGTDPTEGAALASSLLEYFNEKGARIMATTHYGELKAFAYKHEGVINASVEFNTETLQPTYKLLMGTPGLSNALMVAKQLGLEQNIINRAKEYISEEELEISQMIQDLEEKRKQAHEMAEKTELLTLEVERLRSELENQERTYEEKHRVTMEKAYEEAEMVLVQAKRDAEELIKELKIGMKQNSREAQMNAANQARDKLKNKKSVWSDKKESYRATRSGSNTKLKLGDTVQVLSLGQKGNVLTLPNNKGEVQVQIGIMKTSVSVDDLQKTSSMEVKPERINQARMRSEKSKYISPEIDIRGCTSDEAYEVLEKYLDDAILAGLSNVRIIHGKGTGALQRFTTEYLKEHRSIQKYEMAEQNAGGSGVTIAYLSNK